MSWNVIVGGRNLELAVCCLNANGLVGLLCSQASTSAPPATWTGRLMMFSLPVVGTSCCGSVCLLGSCFFCGGFSLRLSVVHHYTSSPLTSFTFFFFLIPHGFSASPSTRVRPQDIHRLLGRGCLAHQDFLLHFPLLRCYQQEPRLTFLVFTRPDSLCCLTVEFDLLFDGLGERNQVMRLERAEWLGLGPGMIHDEVALPSLSVKIFLSNICVRMSGVTGSPGGEGRVHC